MITCKFSKNLFFTAFVISITQIFFQLEILASPTKGLDISSNSLSEDIPAYVLRITGQTSFTSVEAMKMYQQIVGSAGPYKEGDETIGVAATSEQSRIQAQKLLANTKISFFQETPLYLDSLQLTIWKAIDTRAYKQVKDWTITQLKEFLLSADEKNIKNIMRGLNSDVIASAVKVMSNEDLINVSKKVFNPLDGSNIGAKGYLSARIQPNSPTDSPEDIQWQVFDAWAYGVGDLMLGNNPVSSIPSSVLAVERTLKDILVSFNLTDVLPWSVLAHVDIQAQLEKNQPQSTALWFQSIAGTESANSVFGISTEKMIEYAKQRNGKYGMYFETGQGADFTNGQAHGVDMASLESRKYGFARILQQRMPTLQDGKKPWMPVNDVAGFIGPEVFRTREQLVRVALEDTVMGKLHGLTIGLDICSTFHMSISPQDMNWAIDQIMPANPAYIMALPSKQDPMLSYLSTGVHDHLQIREKFGYKINESMLKFFQEIEILDAKGKPTKNFGDPIWVYVKYQQRNGDQRSFTQIYDKGKKAADQARERGIILVSGSGATPSQIPEDVENYINSLYQNAKTSLYSEFNTNFINKISHPFILASESRDREDYILHPTSGEVLSSQSVQALTQLRNNRSDADIQIVISDGLNANALMDDGHLIPYLEKLRSLLQTDNKGLKLASETIVVKNGRVRAGYQIGQILFGNHTNNTGAILHVIGERPGTQHNNFSIYITAADRTAWGTPGKIDHDTTTVVSGVSDTALVPELAAKQTVELLFQGIKSR
jgi:ethanolamine ammonia-lyase large subunit